ncbi:MAG: thermonuclease family protein [Bacteroidetes bacterium]|nr:thermonuclease family protein [Bacteroidota bacterium]
MKAIVVLLLTLSPVLVSYAGPGEIQGKVTAIIDGKTVEVAALDGDRYKVSLSGIDTPEAGQNYAEQARIFLEKLMMNKKVSIKLEGKDRLGNTMGKIYLTDGTDPRVEILKAGFAWTSEKQPLQELEALRQEAKAQGRGLWADENPVPPWKWRRQQSMMEPKVSG